MKKRFIMAIGGLVMMTSVSLVLADPPFWKSLGLTPSQTVQFKAIQKNKNAVEDPAKADKEASTDNLASQVLAKSKDIVIRPILAQIWADTKTIQDTEDNYWEALSNALTPTLVAKLYLKDHQPQSQDFATPVDTPVAGVPTQTPFDWNAYVGLTPVLQAQWENKESTYKTAVQQIEQTRDSSLQQLSQEVQDSATDSLIQSTLTLLFSSVQSLHQTNRIFWTNSLSDFLSPTQEAK